MICCNLNKFYEKIYNRLTTKKIMINGRKFIIKNYIYSDIEEFNEMLILYSIKNIKNKYNKYSVFITYCSNYMFNINENVKFNHSVNKYISDIYLYKDEEMYIDKIDNLCDIMIMHLQDRID